MSVPDVPERARLHQSLGRHVPVGGEPAPVGELPPRLLASWQRSQEYGVPLDDVEPIFAGTPEPDSLFFECGKEVLGALHRTLSGEPISLMLTDPDGLVLNRLCGDPGLVRALDAVHLAPGFAYSERAAGTNGLGLALADRAPTLVRADEHYALSLCTYTCAAAPVFDPLTGRLEGCVNLTTWSQSSNDLLLALAQSAAANTSALMLARAQGARPRPGPRGEVFRVEAPQLEPAAGTVRSLSAAWDDALSQAERALSAGRVVAAIGEPGSGRTTVLAQAERRVRPRGRILAASAPAPQDVDVWLSLWLPELGKPHTAVVARDVDALPVWVAERLRESLTQARRSAAAGGVPFALTAAGYDDIPAPLAALVETIVQVPPLRERRSDILPLARHLAHRVRGRDVDFTPAAASALQDCGWPGNVRQLARVVRDAACRADVVDLCHLPPELLAHSNHRLTRIEAFERDELVRVLTRPGVTLRDAAAELGMSRATVYRKLAHYGIRIPRIGR